MGNTLNKLKAVDVDLEEPDLVNLSSTDNSTASTSSDDSCYNDHANMLQVVTTTESSETTTCLPFLTTLFSKRQESFVMLASAAAAASSAAPGENDLLADSSSCHPKAWRRSLSNSTLSWAAGGESSKEGSDNDDAPLSPSSRSSSWMRFPSEMDYTESEWALSDSEPTALSKITACRSIWIVTTAALPWMTGTAVNPLLRAAYLLKHFRLQAQDAGSALVGTTASATTIASVTLVIPWLESADDRVALYGADWKDATRKKQDAYIRNWLCESAGLPIEAVSLKIEFYPARYHSTMCSIFAMGDFCERLNVANSENAVCILEEPEHVNFYRAPGKTSWRRKFPHVVGIIHTNYKAYASHQPTGLVVGPLVGAMSAWMVRAYCDKVIKLSAVLQEYAPEKEVCNNVHGIRQEFLDMQRPDGSKIYFIGKLLWAKGLDRLLDLQAVYKKTTGEYFEMDIYGSGPEEKEIEQAYLGKVAGAQDGSSISSTTKAAYYAWTPRRKALPVAFMGRLDHAKVSSEYKIFVNPSITEVLCTTTAEAVAMGKFVVIPNHPSNDFFQQFPNCLQYQSKAEFAALLQYALSHEPDPLSEDLRYTLTWEAATERFLNAATVSERDAARRDRVGTQWDERIANVHYELGKGRTGDVIRKVLGGGPVADQVKYEQVVSSPTWEAEGDTIFI